MGFTSYGAVPVRYGEGLADGTAVAPGIPLPVPDPSAARLRELADPYDRGVLRVHLRAVRPLARAADAHRAA
ncbi:hypothetical protein GCM10010123_36740 [Pilimelia anulata]|uniref:Uncharacterized protein n=1 Tax=Pilimelia anulata TaxID=53371 RepID=A0A8J3B9T2_9ACTN|nr:hypothetical protein [Pilimelia anulata]GGK03487.1 hypothetical protein GCM10010123_36740 [Pilimelia anulata]